LEDSLSCVYFLHYRNCFGYLDSPSSFGVKMKIRKLPILALIFLAFPTFILGWDCVEVLRRPNIYTEGIVEMAVALLTCLGLGLICCGLCILEGDVS